MKTGAVLVLSMLVASTASGHEIGTTSVRLASDTPGHWIATITTGPQALLNKLEGRCSN